MLNKRYPFLLSVFRLIYISLSVSDIGFLLSEVCFSSRTDTVCCENRGVVMTTNENHHLWTSLQSFLRHLFSPSLPPLLHSPMIALTVSSISSCEFVGVLPNGRSNGVRRHTLLFPLPALNTSASSSRRIIRAAVCWSTADEILRLKMAGSVS